MPEEPVSNNNFRIENGRILRGENMTRIETFVDAAFAFAITMLVISLDEIPKTVPAFFETARDIPAFLLSALLIAQVWYKHSQWSRHYGLEDSITIFLSIILVLLVLIVIYPLKLVFMGLTNWLSEGYLSPNFTLMNLVELSDLFVFFACGLFILAIIFYSLNLNVLKQASFLNLSPYEKYQCRTENINWSILGAIALISILLAKQLPGLWITTAGFIYFLHFILSRIVIKLRNKNIPRLE
jgi:uncharacterized membrane protein